MNARTGTALACGLALVAVAAVIVFSSGEREAPPPQAAAAASTQATRGPSRPKRFGGAREDCTTRSEAEFPGGFTSQRNLVVGPLVLIGGAYTDAATVREFGGNKFPLLVAAGHRVTVRIARPARRLAGLAYGPLPQGRKTTVRDTHRTVTFIACAPGKPARGYNPHGPSASHADRTPVTFWSGFVLTRAPACIPLDVFIDDAPSARRAALPLGRRCGRA